MSLPVAAVGLSGRQAETLLLADVGNSRIKLAVIADRGLDAGGSRIGLPTVRQRLEIDNRGLGTNLLRQWLAVVKVQRRPCIRLGGGAVQQYTKR